MIDEKPKLSVFGTFLWYVGLLFIAISIIGLVILVKSIISSDENTLEGLFNPLNAIMWAYPLIIGMILTFMGNLIQKVWNMEFYLKKMAMNNSETKKEKSPFSE
tara:strand:- start:31 stop:342 length:312 start_codon:yes stop_codon:yes gene_type:complete